MERAFNPDSKKWGLGAPIFTSERGIVIQDLEGLSQWLTQLPKNNINRCSWLVYNALVSLYEQHPHPQVLYQGLNLLFPIVDHLCSAQRLRFLDEEGLSHQMQLGLLQKANILDLLMVKAYSTLTTPEAAKILSSVELATSIQYAFLRLFHLLLFSAQLYVPIPQSSWQQIYKLLEAARVYNVDKLALLPPKGAPGETITINGLFKVLCLFATSGTYQLTPKESQQIYDSLISWSSRVQLHEPLHEKDIYVFCLESDEPPMRREFMQEKRHPGRWGGIETTLLMEHLKSLLDRLDHTKSAGPYFAPADQGYSASLLRHLMFSWGSSKLRNFRRTPRVGRLKISLGLLNVIDWFKAPEEAAMEAVEGRFVDSSPSGFCIMVPAKMVGKVLVGEVIAVGEIHPEAKNRWYLGVTRWLKQNRQGELFLGVQLLAPRAISVELRPQKNPDHIAKEKLQGLVIPASAQLEQPATLIVPKLFFREGDKLRIVNKDLDMETEIKLTQTLHQSVHYVQFHFEVVADYHQPLENL